MDADATIECDCGAPLAEWMPDGSIVVGGVALPFRRTTDHVGCPRCGAIHAVADLRQRGAPGSPGPAG